MDIRKRIERHLEQNGEVRAAEIIRETGLSRTYVNRIFQQLQREGKLHLVGKSNRARYVRAERGSIEKARAKELTFSRILENRNLEEDIILQQIKQETGIFNEIADNIRRIVDYAFTEMLNNAIEHSRSKRITLRMERMPTGIWFMVLDRGIGIFRNIMQTRHLSHELEAIQELIKGKQTTAPEAHSGEGIFFTSKVGDSLEIKSSTKKLIFDNTLGDTFIRTVKPRIGTQVDFWITLSSSLQLEHVFREYANEEFTFDRTHVAVKLFKLDSGLVSRSQARRVLAGLERFRRITLDFGKVQMVGQGFVDEVFRVWQSHHPDTTIEIVGADENARFMIDRARSDIIAE